MTKKKKSRHGHRVYARKLMGKAEEIMKEFDSSQENKLKQLKISLEDRLETIRALDAEILDELDDEKGIEEEIEEAGDFSERVLGIVVEIESVLSRKDKAESGSDSASPNPTATSATSGNKHAKLPRLTLKSFFGDPGQWLTFWDSFRSAVHENPELNNIDKFNYLKSLLSGSAAATIAGLPLTSDNYGAAIELLTKRFGNKQVIISSHMDSLLKLAPLGNTPDVRKLRATYDKIEAYVRGLQALDVPTETYGSLLVPVLITKIPEDIRLLVGREIKDGEWNLSEILQLLRNEVENRERCEGVNALSLKGKTYSPEDRRSDWKVEPPSAAGLFVENQSSNATHCTFCKQQHPTASCHVVTNKMARKECLKKQGRCFICLRKSHLARDCRSKISCFKCSGRHHVSLCEMEPPTTETMANRQTNVVSGNTTNRHHPSAHASTLHVGSQDSILLQTAQVLIRDKKADASNGTRARVIFDSGSQKSYITQHARDQLFLPSTGKESLLIKTFGNDVTSQPTECEKVKVSVGNINKLSSREIEVFVVPTICSPIGSQEINTAKNQFAHLQDIELADSNHGNEELQIDLLIGADFMWSFFTGVTKRAENGEGPVASCTILGWVLSGPVSGERKKPRLSSVNFVSTHVLKVATQTQHESSGTEELLHRLWDLDSIGIRDKETVHDKFLENISFTNGRYCVTLPLKEKRDPLPDNYELSLVRLNSLIRRLRKEPSTLKEYNQVFEDQLRERIIERVDETEEQPPENSHYLPHQAVIRSDALTTKLRVVFDASARVKPGCLSLNDCTYTGPPLTAGIADILMRFRAHKVGLVADIEKAFLNIEVDKQQRDLMRFLWIDDINKEDPNIIIYRFCRVIFGMNCSPFLLNATLKYHVTEYYALEPVLAQNTLEGLYVDDWTSGGENDDEVYALYKTTNACFASGGFNLRKWASNKKEVIEKIALDRLKKEQPKENEPQSNEDQSFAKMTVGGLDEIDPAKEHKVLGSNWNLAEDTFVLKLNKVVEFARDLEPTKRNVLRIAAKLFDPLGLISPVMVVLRMLLQELCLSKSQWDDAIPQDQKFRLQKWMTDMQRVDNISVNRYYFPEQKTKVNSAVLHGFGDASKGAYCAVVYLCIESEDEYRTSLVAAKTRVAPSTPMTIPRLELLAALILARLVSAVREALNQVIHIKEVFCWTDSVTVFHWIQSDKEFKRFVQNRIDEIHKLTDVKSWRHCPGIENPADIGSRGCLASELVSSSLWWKGPAWLQSSPKNYPKFGAVSDEELTEECFREFKENERNSENVTHAATTVNLTKEPTPIKTIKLTEAIDCEQFNDATKLFRVTALSLKFIRNLKAARNQRREPQNTKPTLTVEEISEAKSLWIREIQEPMKRERDFENLKQQLGLFSGEDDMLRCKGRLGNAPLDIAARYPILLPRRHHVTRLIVEACHRKVNHGGVKETLVELRSEYWVPKGRQLVKKTLHQCVICKKLEGLPYKGPKRADLPETRVTDVPAFTHVGVDFASPLFTKTTRGTAKTYICLFTCATSRAIHLELLPDLTSEAFIRGLQRFAGRRGTPVSITSDNAKTFKRANKDLAQLFRTTKAQDFVANQGITWNFILEKAPWWGGYYERMIQLVKRRLRKILGKAQLTYEELLTVLIEVEGVVNSRPLTYIYPEVTEEPLTPSHLVIGRRLSTLPGRAELSTDEDCAFNLQRRARHLNQLIEHFRKRWTREYLIGLREFHHCGTQGDRERRIKTGDVVLIHDENLPRRNWRLGEVTELIGSRDGYARGAVLQVVSKKGKHIKLRRPIQKLFPLEVNTGKPPENGNVERVQQPEPRPETSRPPRRAAAATADVIRRLLDQQ